MSEHPGDVLAREAGVARAPARERGCGRTTPPPRAGSRASIGVRPRSMRASTGTPTRAAAFSTASSSGIATSACRCSGASTSNSSGTTTRIGGDEYRLLRPRDADRRLEHGRVERAVGERDEEPRLARTARGRLPAPEPHAVRSSRSARSAMTRMSMPGSSRIIRDTSEPRRISTRRRSSGVPTKT